MSIRKRAGLLTRGRGIGGWGAGRGGAGGEGGWHAGVQLPLIHSDTLTKFTSLLPQRLKHAVSTIFFFKSRNNLVEKSNPQ